MSYLGYSECNYMFVNGNCSTYAVPVLSVKGPKEAYEQAFKYFYG